MSTFSSPIWSNRWVHLFLLVGILLIAAFFRFHQFSEFPPGLFFDEAVNGIDAQRLLADGDFSVFYPGNNGREPLHIYFQALALYFWGNQAWSLRLASTFFGLLAFPVLYRLAYALFRQEGIGRARFIGTVALATFAFSYWYLSLSRLAFRSVFLIPLMIATFWLFWHGWQQQKKRPFIYAGVALGLCQYTYLPARLLPVILLLFVLIQSIITWQRSSLKLKQVMRLPLLQGLLITGIVSIIVFAPLGSYFKSHPNMFGQRINSVTLDEDDEEMQGLEDIEEQEALSASALLQTNTLKILKMFTIQGDLNARHNLPGRPVFNTFSGLAFIIGFIIALLNIKQPQFQLILLWLFVMLLPTLLSNEAPHYLRAVGTLPPALILVAVGITKASDWLASIRFLKPQVVYLLMFSLLCLVGLFSTYNDYFKQWETKADLNVAFSVGEYKLAQRVLEVSEINDVAVPMNLFAHPTFRFVIGPVFNQFEPVDDWSFNNEVTFIRKQTEWVNPDVILLSRKGDNEGSLFIPPPLDSAAISKIRQVEEREISSFGEYIDQFPAEPYIEQKNFNNDIALTGYFLEPLYLMPGKTRVDLGLNWQSLGDLNEDYVLFVHLVAVDGEKVDQIDRHPMAEAYPTYLWQEDDAFTDMYHFYIPADIKPGKYRFLVGWVDLATGNRLPVIIDGNASELDAVAVGILTVPDPAYEGYLPAVETDASFGNPHVIELTGYDINPDKLAEQNMLDLIFSWHTPSGVPLDYTVFVHVIDENGELVAQSDSAPSAGRFPTSLWLTGEMVYDKHQIQLPPDIQSADQFDIMVGFYYWATGERLPVFDNCGDLQLDGSFLLTDQTGSCNNSE